MAAISALPPAPVAAGSARRIAALRAWLGTCGYDEPGLRTLLGAKEASLVEAGARPAARRRLLEADSPAALVAMLFLVGESVATGSLVRRIGPLADELQALGLLLITGDLAVPAVRLVPYDRLLIASDLGGAAMTSIPPVDWSASRLASLTVRRHVRRALDIGTGNGLQALLMSRHADRVIATDANERALAFAAFNCALNDIDNIEFRHGHLPDPGAGECYSLVVANRAGPFPDGGAASEAIVRALPTLLEPGGYGTALITWDATHGDIADLPAGWLDGEDVDAWVLHTGTQDPIEAATGLGGAEPDADGAIEHWLAEYGRLGVQFIASGAVVVRLRPGGGTVRAIGLPSHVRPDAGAHLERMFDAPHAPLRPGARVALVPGVELVGCERPGAGGWTVSSYELRLRDGLRFAAELDAEAAAIVRELDGRSTVADLALGVAERRFVQRLVELGFAEAA